MNPLMMLGQNSNKKGNSPQVSQEQVSFVKNMLSQKGMSAEMMVRQICTQRGIDVNEFMEQFRDVSL